MSKIILLSSAVGVAILVAALISLLAATPQRKTTRRNGRLPSTGPDARYVYFNRTLYRFLKYGKTNSRIESLDGTPSFLAPTALLFLDPHSQQPVTKASIRR